MPATPYLETWLRRTRRQLVASGKISQVATILATQDGVPPAEWEQTLRSILNGELSPDLDVLIRIESVLSAPSPETRTSSDDQMEFI